MPRYFPSKKVFIVGVLAIGLLAWSVVYQNTSQKNSAITNHGIFSVAHAEDAFPDTDNDGLYNWEEVLYGTDVNNPDSDGDGVVDGEQYVSSPEDVNVRLSDSVYSAVGRIGDEVQNTPNPVDLLTKEPIVYENPFYRDNLLFRESTDDGNKEYVLEAISVLSKHEEILSIEPLSLADEYLDTKSALKLEEIKELNKKTKGIALLLMEVPVPIEFVEIHLSIANNLFLSAISLDDIEVTTLDPMAGFFAAANYVNHQSKYLESVSELIKMGDHLYE